MQTRLRLDRRESAGFTLADGPHEVGWVVPGRVVFTGFPDPDAAAAAAEVATRIAHQWATGRPLAPRAEDMRVTLTRDWLGFECHVPEGIWHALLLELAQRIHASTITLRHQTPEPAA